MPAAVVTTVVTLLAHGMNSQWGTAFRRDYVDGAAKYFNVDGRLDAGLSNTVSRPNPSREDLEPGERIELHTHRCFIRTG